MRAVYILVLFFYTNFVINCNEVIKTRFLSLKWVFYLLIISYLTKQPIIFFTDCSLYPVLFFTSILEYLQFKKRLVFRMVKQDFMVESTHLDYPHLLIILKLLLSDTIFILFSTLILSTIISSFFTLNFNTNFVGKEVL